MSDLLYEHAPTIHYLNDLVAQIVKGELLVPRFQREFVWRDDQRIELFESVLEGVPFGSIMVWRTRQVLQCHRGVGPVLFEVPPAEGAPRVYLLDGLQRLSTFVAALVEPNEIARAESELARPTIGADRDWTIGYDLELGGFGFASQVEHERRARLPLTVVLSSKKYLAFQRRLSADLAAAGLAEGEVERMIERADAVTSAIRNAKVPVISLVTENLHAATVAFQRINSKGTPMSDVHMVNALTYSPSFDLLASIETLRPRLVKAGWGKLEQRTVLQTCQALLGLSIYEGDPTKVSKTLRELQGAATDASAEPANAIVEKAGLALEKAAAFLRAECGIAGPRLLPFNVLLVCLASVLHDVPAAEGDPGKRRELAAWFWLSVYSRTPFGVSGSIDSLLAFAHDLAKGTKGVKWWGQAEAKVDALPKLMRFDSSRVVTFVAQLCRLEPKTSQGKPVAEPAVLAAREGADALLPLLDTKAAKGLGVTWGKGLKAAVAANRVLADPDDLEALRHGLFDLEPGVLASHAITPEALEALKREGVEAFWRSREQRLVALEQAFLNQTRRTLARYLGAFAFTPGGRDDEVED